MNEQGNNQQSPSTPDQTATAAAWKTAAARAAVEGIPDGAVIGLGTGSTAEAMLHELAARVRQGLRVTGVPSSERTATTAATLGIPLADLNDVQTLMLSIDGADEVLLPYLQVIKGRGGALLREKLVAAASQYRIIVVDSSKLVQTLGNTQSIPVEVVPFGWRHTAGRLVALGCQPTLRMAATSPTSSANTEDVTPFITDCGNYILDCRFGVIAQPEALAAAIKGIVGVVEHGLFLHMTERVFVAGATGVQVYDRPR